ncbi:unknown [Eubacterium sp. CAG:786]|nr:unknown [Eubacterium sp. CAG:786]
MQCDIVALFEDLLVALYVVDLAGKLKSVLNGKIRVSAVNVHAEFCSCVSYQDTDSAQTDNTELLAHDLRTYELALALLDQLSYLVALALESLDPVHSSRDLSGGKKQTSDDQFLNCIRVSAGGVEYYNALLAALVNRDIVDACARSCDSQQVGGQFHLVHGSGANQDSVRICDIITNGVLALVEQVGTACGDLVKCKYVYHVTISFDQVYQPFSVSNFFMNSTSFSTPSIGIAL